MVGWGGGGGEKLGIKLKLSFSWGLGLAELGNNKLNNTIFLGFDSIELNIVSLIFCFAFRSGAFIFVKGVQ